MPRSRISPTRFPAKSFPGPTTVRLHKALKIFKPYVCVFVVWLSVAVLPETLLSSQVRPLTTELIRMPSRFVTMSELLMIVLLTIWFRSPLLMYTPCGRHLQWCSTDDVV